MTALEAHLANLLAATDLGDGLIPDPVIQAAAVLADPTLRAIIELAARFGDVYTDTATSPEVRVLLADWRAQHAE